MSEIKKTYTFCGVAAGLLIIALISSPRIGSPDAFIDQGEPFFPEFTDPNVATSLEVIDFDSETGSPLPFKVSFTGGKWIIPSHNNYPADGEDRLAKTAAGVIGIIKDDFRSDNPTEHDYFGVLDPLDETVTSLTGRGQRVTIKGTNEAVLADFIIGKEVGNRNGFRFVRVPDSKLVYAVRMDIDISAKFSDWIEDDLLKLSRSAIEKITLKDYSIDERSGSIDQRDEVVLEKEDNDWTANNMGSDQEVDDTAISDLLSAVDNLSIVGVRPKPIGLSESLQRTTKITIAQRDVLDLQSKGYFFTRNGQLVSNEGELQVLTNEAVLYTLRFGEIVYGTGETVSAGTGTPEEPENGPGENRYLFISADFKEDYFVEPPQPPDTAFLDKADSLWTDSDRSNEEIYDTHEEWANKVEKGKQISGDLNGRFAEWYYVISAESFDKLRKNRSDLVKKKDEDEKK